MGRSGIRLAFTSSIAAPDGEYRLRFRAQTAECSDRASPDSRAQSPHQSCTLAIMKWLMTNVAPS